MGVAPLTTCMAAQRAVGLWQACVPECEGPSMSRCLCEGRGTQRSVTYHVPAGGACWKAA